MVSCLSLLGMRIPDFVATHLIWFCRERHRAGACQRVLRQVVHCVGILPITEFICTSDIQVTQKVCPQDALFKVVQFIQWCWCTVDSHLQLKCEVQTPRTFNGKNIHGECVHWQKRSSILTARSCLRYPYYCSSAYNTTIGSGTIWRPLYNPFINCMPYTAHMQKLINHLLDAVPHCLSLLGNSNLDMARLV